MAKSNLSLGRQGEELAAAFLSKQGYRILERNYATPIGEIDIVASDKGTVCFIEVKARRCDKFGSPEESVTARKRHQISKAALLFLKERDLLQKNARFDVVSVLFKETSPEIQLIKNAFELGPEFTY